MGDIVPSSVAMDIRRDVATPEDFDSGIDLEEGSFKIESRAEKNLPKWAKAKDIQESPTNNPYESATAPWEQPFSDELVRRIENYPGQKEELSAGVRLGQMLTAMGVKPESVDAVKSFYKKQFEIKSDKGLLERGKQDWEMMKLNAQDNYLWRQPLFARGWDAERAKEWWEQANESAKKLDGMGRERNFFGQLGFLGMNQLPVYYEGAKKGWKIGAIGATVVGVGTALTLSPLVGIFAALKVGVIGIQAGIIEEQMEFSAAMQYKQMSLDPQYSKLSENAKKSIAYTYGVASGIIEMFQMKALASPVVGAVTQRANKVLGRAIVSSIKPTGVVNQWLRLGGVEFGEEMLQKLSEFATEDIGGRLWNEWNNDPNRVITHESWLRRSHEFFEEMAYAGPLALMMSGILSVAPSKVIGVAFKDRTGATTTTTMEGETIIEPPPPKEDVEIQPEEVPREKPVGSKYVDMTQDYNRGDTIAEAKAQRQAKIFLDRQDGVDVAVDLEGPSPAYEQTAGMQLDSKTAIGEEGITVEVDTESVVLDKTVAHHLEQLGISKEAGTKALRTLMERGYNESIEVVDITRLVKKGNLPSRQPDIQTDFIDPDDRSIAKTLAQPLGDETQTMEQRVGKRVAQQLELFEATSEERYLDGLSKQEAKQFVIDVRSMAKYVREEIKGSHMGLDERDISWLKQTREKLGNLFLHPARMLDAFEGGKGMKGKLYQFFWEGYNKLDRIEFDLNNVMAQQIQDQFANLWYKGKKLTPELMKFKTVKFQLQDGRISTFTLSGLADIWASNLEVLKRKAYVDGLFRGNEFDYRNVVRQIPSDIRTVAERGIENFAVWKKEIDPIFEKVFGRPLTEYTNWSPMPRDVYQTTSLEADLFHDENYRDTVKRKSDLPRFGRERNPHIDPETQESYLPKPQFIENQAATMKAISHFLAKGEWLAKADAMYKAIRVDLRNKIGSTRIKWFKEYLDTLAHPETAYGLEGVESAFRRVRQNSTLALIGYNLGIILKQGPSILMYTVESGQNFAIEMARAATIRGLADQFEMVRRYSQVIPQMLLDPVFNEIAMGNYKKFGHNIHKAGNVGTWGIRNFDKMIKVVGWNSVYKHYWWKTADHDFAVNQADRVTALYQPTARHQDIASIYKKGEMARTMMMFSKQLMQYTNTVFYDVPMYIKQQGMRGRAFGYFAAMGAAFTSIWMITNKRIPKDKDDLLSIGTSFLNLLPIMGRVANSVGRPWSGIEYTPLSGISHSINTIMTKGWTSDLEKKILGLMQGLTAVGIPAGAMKKHWKAGRAAVEGRYLDSMAELLGQPDWDAMVDNFWGDPDWEETKKKQAEMDRRLR